MVSELLEEAREEKLAPEHREVIKQVAGAAYEGILSPPTYVYGSSLTSVNTAGSDTVSYNTQC